MTQDQKSLAQMYALGAICHSQMVENQDSASITEMEHYAEQYSKDYEAWLDQQREKQESSIKEDLVGFAGLVVAAISVLSLIAMTA